MPSSNIRLTIPVTPPGTMGTTKGGHIYVEAPDQSSTPAARMDGVTLMDGSATMQGDWAPVDMGKFPYVASEQPWKTEIYTGLDPQVSHDIRVYVSSYSDDVDIPLVRFGSPGATPSYVVTVAAQTQGKPNSGSNVTPFLVTGISGSVSSAVSVGGKLRRPIGITVDLSGLSAHRPTNWAFQLLGFKDGDLTQDAVLASGYITQDGLIPAGPDGIPTPHTFGPEEPTATTSITIYAVAGLITGDNYMPRRNGNLPPGTFVPNNIVPGITASCVVSIGTVTGVTDPTNFIQALLDTSVGVNSAVFGVLPLGVDNARIAALAVDTTKLAALAVTAAKLGNSSVTATAIASLAVGTAAIQTGAITTALIANANITNALIANLAVGTAQLQNLAVTNAKINDLDVSKLNAGTISVAVLLTAPIIQITSGVTTINLDGTNYLKISDTGISRFTQVNASQIRVQATFDAFNFTSMVLGSVKVSGPSGFNTATLTDVNLIIGGQQVIGSRIGVRPVTLADVINAGVTHGFWV